MKNLNKEAEIFVLPQKQFRQVKNAKDRDQSIEQLEQLAKDLGKASSSIPVLKLLRKVSSVTIIKVYLFKAMKMLMYLISKLIKPGLLNSIVNKAASCYTIVTLQPSGKNTHTQIPMLK